MQLATYIQDLLYRYECVIIPGFGAFLTQYQSASYHQENATWYPPGKSISFNKQLQTNDGLLANYMATVEGISYENALQKIRNYTGTLTTQLASENEVAIEKIGTFYRDASDIVTFEPQLGARFSTSSYGLDAVMVSQIEREVKEREESPILFTPHKRERFPYLKYAAVGVIALMLAGAAGFQWQSQMVEEHNESQKIAAENLINDQLQEATFEIPTHLPAVTIEVPKETGKYHIVAGAFRMQQNADKKLRQLVEKGFAAQNIGANAYGLHQVIYASYENRLEALKALRSIKNTENKDAWLLVKQLD